MYDMVFRGRGGGQFSAKEYKVGTIENCFPSIQEGREDQKTLVYHRVFKGRGGEAVVGKTVQRGDHGKLIPRQYGGGGEGGHRILQSFMEGSGQF